MLAMYFFSYDLFLTERTEWHPKLANKLVSEKQAVHVHKVCLVFLEEVWVHKEGRSYLLQTH